VKNAGTFSRALASAGVAFDIHTPSRPSYRHGLGRAPRRRMRPACLSRLRCHDCTACRVGAIAAQRAGTPEIGHRHRRSTNGRTRREPIGKALPTVVIALQPLARQRRHRWRGLGKPPAMMSRARASRAGIAAGERVSFTLANRAFSPRMPIPLQSSASCANTPCAMRCPALPMLRCPRSQATTRPRGTP
jgi:hypothetical protein